MIYFSNDNMKNIKKRHIFLLWYNFIILEKFNETELQYVNILYQHSEAMNYAIE